MGPRAPFPRDPWPVRPTTGPGRVDRSWELGDEEVAMATHPGDRELNAVLRDGSTVHVCPAKPADAPAVRLLLRGLSDRSRWLRFFSACPDLATAARWALEVDDAMQGRGLGTALLCQLAEAANQLGIQVLDAEVLPENRQMLRVFRDCGYPFKVHSLPGVELVELRTSLPSTGLSLKSRPTRRHERTSWARGQSGTNSA